MWFWEPEGLSESTVCCSLFLLKLRILGCLQMEIAMQIAEVMLKYMSTGVCTRLGNRHLSSNESISHFSLLKKHKGITALKFYQYGS